MDWLWIAAVAWVLLAVPAAVVLGRAIRRADLRELGRPEDPPRTTPPPTPPRSPSDT